jgi:hypothetical protein
VCFVEHQEINLINKEIHMKKERILPFAMATKLTEEDLKDVSASGTSVGTSHVTYSSNGGTDADIDINIDM